MSERKVARIARNGFREIVVSLQERVASGMVPAGSYLPTERELQEQFGASRATIRKVLAALVDSGWAKSVPNKGVVAVRGRRPNVSHDIALIDAGSYVLKVLGVRIGKMLRDQGFHLVHMGGSPDYPLDYALQRALDHDFAGAIVWSFRGFPDPAIVDRARQKMALVALDHRLGTCNTDLVSFDYERAAFEATEQLIKQGCRRIGVTGMLDMLEITHQRFRGYMRAMFAHGLQPLPEDYLFVATSGHDHPTTGALHAALLRPDRPDGFFVLQDIFVPSMIETAMEAGLRVPEDVRISTIGDDVDVWVDGRGLTTTALDWDSLAEHAVELLLRRIEDMNQEIAMRYAPHRLVVRGLCGAPESEWAKEPEKPRGFAGELPFPRSQFRYSSRWAQDAPPIPHSGGILS